MKTNKKEIVRKSELLAQIRADLKAWEEAEPDFDDNYLGQDAEEIDKGLLGDFRTGDERRIGKIEVVPVMQGQVRRPVFRRRQRDRHVGQTEFLGFLLLGM